MTILTERYKTAMENAGIQTEVIAQFDFENEVYSAPLARITLIEKMDELLTPEQCLAVLETQGCGKTGKADKDCRKFAKEHGDKSLAEKVKLLSGERVMLSHDLEDNAITVTMGGYQNGKHKGKTTCCCGTIKRLKQPFTVSKTYCGCCAGHFRYNYQNALGVKLRLKEIVSSPLDSNGEKPCSIRFEIVK